MMPSIRPVETLPTTRAADGCWRQVRRVGNDDLHGHRAEADEQRGGQERQRMGGERGGEQRRGAERDHRADQGAVLDEIAERHDQQQPGAVADLRHGDDQSRRGMRQAERGADRSDQRLRIVDVGGDHATGRGEHEGQALRHRIRPGRGLDRGIHRHSHSLQRYI
ncbi:hypothetical protein ABIA43_004791 [Bradyrhizobium sp. USDA 328]